MKKHLVTAIGILILLVSCKQKEIEKPNASKQKSTTEFKVETEEKIEKITIPEQYIESDSLLTQLVSDLYKIVLNSNFEVGKEPIRNRYTDADVIVMDTIITHTFDNTNIKFHKTENKQWIYAASIENLDFKLLNSIGIGTRKVTLENRIKIELKSDLIKIGDFEQTSVFIFKFEDGIIKNIFYEGYVD